LGRERGGGEEVGRPPSSGEDVLYLLSKGKPKKKKARSKKWGKTKKRENIQVGNKPRREKLVD